ncbi:MAG: ABC transporter ATP-binding protein [Acidimicrobiia bacterium]
MSSPGPHTPIGPRPTATDDRAHRASRDRQAATAVTVRSLVKSYGADAPRVVDDVDVDIAPGTLTALVGPSGCGKTTTLKIIAGLLRPDAGDVRFDDRVVTAVPAERRRAAMVFQKPLLFPQMTVAENVGFGLRVRGGDRRLRRRRVAELLDRVRLPGLEDRRVGELSGGQEQRVALARALVIEPDVLLLDEPLSQLDAALRVEMRDLVRSIQKDLGVTTLFVTHDQDEAVILADHVALMLDGSIAQYGEPRSFYEQPASLAVARFFGARNEVPGRVDAGWFRAAFGGVPLAPGTPDGPGVLVVRPETITLAPALGPDVTGADGRATVTGRVIELRYLGTRVAAIIEASGMALHVDAPPSVSIALGEAVSASWPLAAATVFPPAGPEGGPALPARRALPADGGERQLARRRWVWGAAPREH